jgi:glycosyltransferase involved in cell wall biosynthesis
MIGPDRGDGSLQRTQRLADELGIADRIAYHGPVPKQQVPDWLNRADIFLNTSRVDNTPVSVLEAGACGLCIVSTNVGGLPYLLRDHHDALLTPDDDAQAMAEAVRSILTEPDLGRRLSRNAHDTARRCDWSEVLPQWEALLTAAAASGRP